MATNNIKTGLSGFAEYLAGLNIIPEKTLTEAAQSAKLKRSSLITNLLNQKAIEAKKIAEEAMAFFGLPLFDLEAFDRNLIPKELMQLSIVQNRGGLPLYRKDHTLLLAVIDPMHPNLDEVKFLTKLEVHLVLVEADKLGNLIDGVMSTQLISGLGDLDDAALDNVNVKSFDEEVAPAANLATEVDDTPIVRYVNKILIDAISTNASDVHFEPYEGFCRIRYRQDGLLHKIASPPLKVANYIVARIKIMANLDISERRVPQDGRFKLILSRNKTMDFRVSTCPTLYGEKVVMRLLNTSQALPSIDDSGMDEKQVKAFKEAIDHSQGMILVCGPTGSGKTVTLYTALNVLNQEEKNISTAEDPVEIPVPGINQVHINLKTGMTFSAALRAFLRQDPDIIMVGEVRDLETAEIAVKAAQTGHLVLSTLHTNSAPETVLRLANMGVAAFNIASSLLIVIAQRLVRKLCVHCRVPADYSKEILLHEGFTESEIEKLKIYEAGGCKECYNGFKGRCGIFQVMPISEEMGQLIMAGGNALDIAALAKKEGISDLRDSGLNKVRAGITSLTELNRVFKG